MRVAFFHCSFIYCNFSINGSHNVAHDRNDSGEAVYRLSVQFLQLSRGNFSS